MLLSCRILRNVLNTNVFEYVDVARFSEGDAATIYLQLIDASQNRAREGFYPAGRRYMPANGAVLQVTLDHVDEARRIARTATQPFAQDPSIWSFQVLASDRVRGTVTLRLQLTEGSVVTRGSLRAGLLVDRIRP